jgi:hypothetical protein
MQLFNSFSFPVFRLIQDFSFFQIQTFSEFLFLQGGGNLHSQCMKKENWLFAETSRYFISSE